MDLHPGPACNEDLLDLSETYQQKLVDFKKDLNSNKEASEASMNSMREAFCDWSHMTIKTKVMEGLKTAISRKFEAAMGGTDEPVAINCDEAILVDQLCWLKITSYFGLLGPEIMFFSHKDPMIDEYMPDLEPIKVSIHMFDERLKRIKVFSNDSMQMLISRKLTVKQLMNFMS